MAVAKRLSDLGLQARSDHNGSDPEITGICVDSRQTKPGYLFAAMPGTRVHGGEFVQYAVRMGATAVLTDALGAQMASNTSSLTGITMVIEDEPRLALAKAASRFYEGQPAHMIAVTGTNGKTSVANFTRQIWTALGLKGVNFGTTGVEGAFEAELKHTTPEPITLHRLLNQLVQAGITHAAMEASSHGLAQRRLDGVHLTAAGFTNFTQDHLDYHETFEAYFMAKTRLFSEVLPGDGTAVINLDDPKGTEVLKIAQTRGQKVITVGSDACDLEILNNRFDATGQDLRFAWQGQAMATRLSLVGGFQAQNVLLAAGLVIACGGHPTDVFSALKELTTVPGRMELAATRTSGASVFVDYAHTPDALKTALMALRPHVLGRLIVVLGAGGDRDRTKRPLMGAAAATYGDVVIVTDDNPRTEDPALIRQMVMEGCPKATNIADRAEAILRGVDALQAGDALLIAGKGHEVGQTIGTDIFPFNDVEQASVAVAALDGLGA